MVVDSEDSDGAPLRMVAGRFTATLADVRSLHLAASSTPPKPKASTGGKAAGKKGGAKGKVKGKGKSKGDDDDFSGASSGSDDDSMSRISSPFLPRSAADLCTFRAKVPATPTRARPPLRPPCRRLFVLLDRPRSGKEGQGCTRRQGQVCSEADDVRRVRRHRAPWVQEHRQRQRQHQDERRAREGGTLLPRSLLCRMRRGVVSGSPTFSSRDARQGPPDERTELQCRRTDSVSASRTYRRRRRTSSRTRRSSASSSTRRTCVLVESSPRSRYSGRLTMSRSARLMATARESPVTTRARSTSPSRRGLRSRPSSASSGRSSRTTTTRCSSSRRESSSSCTRRTRCASFPLSTPLASGSLGADSAFLCSTDAGHRPPRVRPQADGPGQDEDGWRARVELRHVGLQVPLARLQGRPCRPVRDGPWRRDSQQGRQEGGRQGQG